MPMYHHSSKNHSDIGVGFGKKDSQSNPTVIHHRESTEGAGEFLALAGLSSDRYNLQYNQMLMSGDESQANMMDDTVLDREENEDKYYI